MTEEKQYLSLNPKSKMIKKEKKFLMIKKEETNGGICSSKK